MSFAPITELEAINEILATIGETPINSLESSGSVDVALAVALLHGVSRKVQTVGWHFNSEKEYELGINVDGKIVVPGNVLSIDTSAIHSSYDVTRRGNFIYNRKDHTFVFTTSLKFDLTWFLPFEDIPQAARDYITVRAARMFQDQQLGSQVTHAFTQEDEDAALAVLKSDEGEEGDYNILWDNLSVALVLER